MASRRLAATALSTAGAIALLLSGGLVFGATDDTRRTGEGSASYDQLVEPVMEDEEPEEMDIPQQPSTFGLEGTDVHTLVLYDTDGEDPGRYELDGIAAANLATHFGMVTALPVADYAQGDMHEYSAVVYLGSSWEQQLPESFTTDVLSGRTPVMWAGSNITELPAGEPGSPQAEDFAEAYGWDAAGTRPNLEDTITSVLYQGTELNRDERITGPLQLPVITAEEEVEILAEALCGSAGQPADCQGAEGETVPWALRSQNLIYVTEVPFDFMDETSRYLAWADLYYDLLGSEAEPTRQAAVRLEDVGPESDPEDLRRIADLLSARAIPFQVALFQVHVAKVPGADPVRWYAVSLEDSPEVVATLKYMEERGGTMIHHGVTHQYGAWDNPYSGQSGADYEFFSAHCSATEKEPYAFEDCQDDSWVRLTGPVSRDAVEDHAARLATGRQIQAAVGLQAPSIFEVPHYAASPNAYAAIAEDYEYRYERVQYFAGLLSGDGGEATSAITQFFPYRVHDIYGQTVLPENLGNVSEEQQNNHPARPPEFLLRNAEANLVLRESTASFFFHPFLDSAYLEELIDGIEELDYTFVPAEEL